MPGYTPFDCSAHHDVGPAGVRLALRGELDVATAPRVQASLALAEGQDPELVVVDLRGLTFMDSTGLHLLLDADARHREAGRRLVVIPGNGAIGRLMSLTGTDALLTLADDVVSA